MTTSLTQVYIL